MTGKAITHRPAGVRVFVFFHAVLYVWSAASLSRDLDNALLLLNVLAAAPVIIGLLKADRAGWFMSCAGLVHLSLGYFLLFTLRPEALIAYAYALAFVVILFTLGFLASPAWQEAFGVKGE